MGLPLKVLQYPCNATGPASFDAGPGLVVRALISKKKSMPRDHTENPVAVQAGCRWVTIPGDRGPAAVLRIRRRGAGMAR